MLVKRFTSLFLCLVEEIINERLSPLVEVIAVSSYIVLTALWMIARLRHAVTDDILVFQEKFGLVRLRCAWYCCRAKWFVLIVLTLLCCLGADHQGLKSTPIHRHCPTLLFVECSPGLATTHD